MQIHYWQWDPRKPAVYFAYWYVNLSNHIGFLERCGEKCINSEILIEMTMEMHVLTYLPCSLSFKNDLLPDESFCLWKNEMPVLSALRALAVGTLLGPEKEKLINWYLRPGYPEKLVAELSPQIAKLGEVILHCALSVCDLINRIHGLMISDRVI